MNFNQIHQDNNSIGKSKRMLLLEIKRGEQVNYKKILIVWLQIFIKSLKETSLKDRISSIKNKILNLIK